MLKRLSLTLLLVLSGLMAACTNPSSPAASPGGGTSPSAPATSPEDSPEASPSAS